jgi:E3 ubiquitin-protein ligase UBR7
LVREEQLVLADANHDNLSGAESATTDTDERIPPSRLAPDEHEAFVCRDCVLAITPLRQWAGTPGVMMLVQASGSRDFVTLGRLASATDEVESTSHTDTSDSMGEGPLGKRKTFTTKADSDIYYMRETKRLRLSDGTRCCEAPAGCESAQLLLNNISRGPVMELSLPHFVGTGDVFLAPDFRKRWCSCSQVRYKSPCAKWAELHGERFIVYY